MKKIYLIRTYTGTFPAKVIDTFLREDYVHLSISLDSDLNDVYGFGRLKSIYPLKGGFQKEDMTKKPFYDAPTKIYEVKVSKEAYKVIQTRIDEVYEARDAYGFNMLGLLTAYFKIPWNRPNAYFCSEFIATLFKEAAVIHEHAIPSIMTPNELLSQLDTKPIFEGIMSEYLPLEEKTALYTSLSVQKQTP